MQLSEQPAPVFSRRAAEVTPFLAMEVLEEAQRLERQGQHIVHLEVGEPDFDTPSCIVEAAQEALTGGRTHYTHSMGVYALREAICQHYLDRYGAQVTPDQIVVTSGTSPALSMIFGALLEPGDEVILSNPHYACYPNFIRYAGGVPVYVDIREEDGWQFHAEDVARKITPRTRAIFINSPANPTGSVLDAARMADIAALGPMVVSDEIYHGLVYQGREHSILEYQAGGCALNGFSKLYAMTGWRLGYIIAPLDLARVLQIMHQNFHISASDFAQRAGIAALQDARTKPELDQMVATYGRRREYMLGRLEAMGFRIPHPPTGAFYILVNFRRYTSDSLAFAFQLLREAGVAATPGIDFGSNAEGYLRFSYANSVEQIAEGMDRLERWLAGRGVGR
jgi:(5-formylfuran-3-yl)methyl phosphate transaminase